MLESSGLCYKATGNNPKRSTFNYCRDFNIQITIEITVLIATSYYIVYQNDVACVVAFYDHLLKVLTILDSYHVKDGQSDQGCSKRSGQS